MKINPGARIPCQYPTELDKYGMPVKECRAPSVEFRNERAFVRYVCATHSK